MSNEPASEMTKRSGSMGRMIGWTLFGLSTVALCWVAIWAYSLRRSAADEIAVLQRNRAQLQEMSARLVSGAGQADGHKRVIQNVFRHCRAAEDIPVLGGERIVGYHHGFGQLGIYVPEGSHRIEVSFKWKTTLNSGSAADPDTLPEKGEKNWSVPLLPASGYWFELQTERTAGPVGWELTGNHPEFQKRSEILPIDKFAHRSSSWSGSDAVHFPNQIPPLLGYGLKDPASIRPGFELMDASLRGPSDGGQLEIAAVVRIVSDAPPCVSAKDAIHLIVRGKGDLLMPYEGGGKYSIRVSDTQTGSREDAEPGSVKTPADREDAVIVP